MKELGQFFGEGDDIFPPGSTLSVSRQALIEMQIEGETEDIRLFHLFQELALAKNVEGIAFCRIPDGNLCSYTIVKRLGDNTVQSKESFQLERQVIGGIADLFGYPSIPGFSIALGENEFSLAESRIRQDCESSGLELLGIVRFEN